VCRPGSFFVLPILMLFDGRNPANFCFDVPRDVALTGLSLCVQGAALQIVQCLDLTDAVAVTVQPR
jgi:hypothetical protein